MNDSTLDQSTREDTMQDRTTQDRTTDRDREPEEIRRDIRQTRGEMDRTVDELVDRFSVGNLVDEAWQRMRKGSGPDVGGMLREHPVPIALMGLGLGWLAVEQASGRSMSTDSFGSGDSPSGDRKNVSAAQGNRSWDNGGQAHSDGKARTGENGRADSDAIADRVSDQASEAMSTAREKVSDMKASTKAAGARTRAGFQEFLAESPLTVGSIVFGLGLASGLAVPSSAVEDRQFGQVSDRIKAKAGEIGSEAAERAGEIGHEVADTAMTETRNQVDDLRAEAGSERNRS